MNNIDNEFLKSYYSSDIGRIRKYLITQGKKPKPISPFTYIKKDTQNESTTDKSTVTSIN